MQDTRDIESTDVPCQNRTGTQDEHHQALNRQREPLVELKSSIKQFLSVEFTREKTVKNMPICNS